MTTESILLDSDIVIHLLHNQPQIMQSFEFYYQNNTQFLLSPIVVAEIYAGAFPKEYQTIEDFFMLCKPLPLTLEVAKQAGHYAKQYRKAYHTISLEDYILAATAKIEACLLWTNNHKHFPMQDIILFNPDLF